MHLMHIILNNIDIMNLTSDSLRSNWWSNLLDFGLDVLQSNRKNMGVSQAQIANTTGLNQSEISRIENGLARPKDITNFELICKAYKLTDHQRNQYSTLVLGTVQTSKENDLLSLLMSQIDMIYELNRSGQPILSIRQSQMLRSFIQNSLPSSSNKTDLCEIMARITLEESVARWDSDSDRKYRTDISNILQNSMELTEQFDPNNLMANTYHEINSASIDYVNGQHKTALPKFESLLESRVLRGKLWELETLRMTLICSSKVGDYKTFSKTEKEINFHLRSSLTPIEKVLLAEGLARAYSEFSPVDSLSLINQSQKFLTDSNVDTQPLVVREIQVKRSLLETLVKLGKKSAAKKIANETINQASTYGLKRYHKQVNSIIKLAGL